MSVQAMAWAIEQRVGDPSLKVLLMNIANFAGVEDTMWHSQKRMAYDTEISERTLRRKLNELVDMGLIQIDERRRPDGTKTSSMITLLRHQPAKMAGGDNDASGQINQRPKPGGTSGQIGGSPAATKVAGHEPSRIVSESSEDSLFSGSPALPAPTDDWPKDFVEAFWQLYPPYRRSAKKTVAAKLTSIRGRREVTWAVLMAGLQRYVDTAPGEYAKGPVVWLNGGCWDDEYLKTGARNEANRNGNQKGGYSSLGARLRASIGDPDYQRSPPDDLEPINRH